MSIDFDDDINEMLSEDDHGTVAIHNGRSLNGILSNTYFDQPGGIGIEGSEPVFVTSTQSAAGVRKNDILKIENRDFTVIRPQDDDTGLTRLILRDA